MWRTETLRQKHRIFTLIINILYPLTDRALLRLSFKFFNC